ncbi:MAG: hypothetical protein ABIY40_07720, partial [Rhodanobacteraceae bacterium]
MLGRAGYGSRRLCTQLRRILVRTRDRTAHPNPRSRVSSAFRTTGKGQPNLAASRARFLPAQGRCDVSRQRWKHKGRSESDGYFALPRAVIRSPNYKMLPTRAVKLLCDMGEQYRGHNNGDLSAAWGIMRELGWKSRDTLDKAERDLLRAGMIELTRQGGLNRCNLYALTWHSIDECKGKLDVPETRVPSSLWRKPTLVEKQNASPESVSIKPGICVNSS